VTLGENLEPAFTTRGVARWSAMSSSSPVRPRDPAPPQAPPPTPALLRLRSGAGRSVSARIERIDGRLVVWVDIDPAHQQGALTPADGETIAAAADTALAERMPLVMVVASSGADIEAGIAAVHGWGLAARSVVACSGVVPLLFVVNGPAVSGPALLLGLADIVVMTTDAYAFVSGPHMVRQFTGENLTNQALGGTAMHARTSGVAHLVVDDLAGAREAIADILSFLPSNNDEEAPWMPSADPVDRLVPELTSIIPDSATGSYDVRNVIRGFVDDEVLLELRAEFAANLVTAFATIGGRPVGIVANQPQSIAGTLDIAASQKGGRFVSMCDAFNLPIVTVVDTSGFYPGKDLEWRGMIRYGAQMAFAYARASVPRVCLTLRKSYGGAYIVMDSKYMGNDVSFAWPSAEIAVMGAKGAVEILHRRATPAERVELERAYDERMLNPYVAAERGSIDRVIEPAETRREIARCIDYLASKRERLRVRKHDNTPL
jgi:acetyl-CoA carboxylase carboxyltransferase component